ncbi:hypothetical protein COO60DRAFT_1216782 [Scenedesmus sp. NREL 46B-D3]|nr:hypothetical protein COO60DRAFT_1216782 [Scenedesmus sp. NREL 46B-D3]
MSCMPRQQEQQQQQQQRQFTQQHIAVEPAAAAPAAGFAMAPAADATAVAVAPATVPGSPPSALKQQQAAGAVMHTKAHRYTVDVSSMQQQRQQHRSHRIEDMVWQEFTSAAPTAATKGSSDCADTTCGTADSCDRSSLGDTEHQALAECEASCCSSSAALSGTAAATAAAAAAAAAVAADYGQSSCSNLRQLLRVQPLTLTQQLLSSVQLAVAGFGDPCLECSYVVFKNHSSALMDTTALLVCGGMLAAATMRCVDFRQDPQALGKLGVVLLYGVLFFLPYVVMQLRRRLFLRHREVLLVLGRALSAALLVLVAVNAAPQPDAWMGAVGNTLALQLQNAVILPLCQQLRLPAAAAIAAAHLPSDALVLALAMPMRAAALSSVLMQLCMLLVTVAQDAWCRRRFMQRYLGVAGGEAAPGQQQGRRHLLVQPLGRRMPGGQRRLPAAWPVAATQARQCGSGGRCSWCLSEVCELRLRVRPWKMVPKAGSGLCCGCRFGYGCSSWTGGMCAHVVCVWCITACTIRNITAGAPPVGFKLGVSSWFMQLRCCTKQFRRMVRSGVMWQWGCACLHLCVTARLARAAGCIGRRLMLGVQVCSKAFVASVSGWAWWWACA